MNAPSGVWKEPGSFDIHQTWYLCHQTSEGRIQLARIKFIRLQDEQSLQCLVRRQCIQQRDACINRCLVVADIQAHQLGQMVNVGNKRLDLVAKKVVAKLQRSQYAAMVEF